MSAFHCVNTTMKVTPQSRSWMYRWGLFLFYYLTYIVPLGWRPLLAPDETRYAQIGGMMARTGELIVPHFLGLRYFEKPILGYWAYTACQWLLGSTNFSARLSCAIAAGLSALMVYKTAMLLWREERCAACCALAYLSMMMVFSTGTYISIDAPLSVWVSLIMLSTVWAYSDDTRASRCWGYVVIGIASGAGVMTKGFIALAMPVLVMVPWLIMTQRTCHLFTYGMLAIVAAVLTVLPWGIAVQQRDPQFWSFFFWHEHIQRFFSQTDAQHAAPFYFFVPIVLIGMFPWWGSMLSFSQSLSAMTVATRRYLLLWSVMPLLFFSCASGKLAPYILPCFPALGLIVGYTLYALYANSEENGLRWNGALAAIGAFAAVMGLLLFGRQYFDLRTDMLAYVLSLSLLTLFVLLGAIVVWKPKAAVILALVPTLMAWGMPFCFPQGRINSKAPVVFVQQHAALLDSSAILVSNDISDAAAMSWVTRRDNIVMYDVTGELEFGLQDHPERHVSAFDLPAWLWNARACGRVTMMLDNDQRNIALPVLLGPDRIEKQGTYSLLSFPERNVSNNERSRCAVAMPQSP